MPHFLSDTSYVYILRMYISKVTAILSRGVWCAYDVPLSLDGPDAGSM
jgi:hypothetical protein